MDKNKRKKEDKVIKDKKSGKITTAQANKKLKVIAQGGK